MSESNDKITAAILKAFISGSINPEEFQKENISPDLMPFDCLDVYYSGKRIARVQIGEGYECGSLWGCAEEAFRQFKAL